MLHLPQLPAEDAKWHIDLFVVSHIDHDDIGAIAAASGQLLSASV